MSLQGVSLPPGVLQDTGVQEREVSGVNDMIPLLLWLPLTRGSNSLMSLV